MNETQSEVLTRSIVELMKRELNYPERPTKESKKSFHEWDEIHHRINFSKKHGEHMLSGDEFFELINEVINDHLPVKFYPANGEPSICQLDIFKNWQGSLKLMIRVKTNNVPNVDDLNRKNHFETVNALFYRLYKSPLNQELVELLHFSRSREHSML